MIKKSVLIPIKTFVGLTVKTKKLAKASFCSFMAIVN
tara:strand:+ start:2101 stop:2211 length:111 start_codon:yes stop_codon:yes gene_type:complete